MTLRLTDTVERKPLLSLTEGGEAEYPSGFVGDISTKLHLALGENSPGEKALETSYVTGSSAQYKRILADQERLRAMTARNDVLQSIAETDPALLTPEMVEVTQGLAMTEIQSPDLANIVERRYSQLYTTTAAAYEDNSIVDDAMEESPEMTAEVLDRAEVVVFKNNLLATKAAEVGKEIENQSWGGYVWDFTERMVPFVDWYQRQNQVGKESDFVSSVLPGANLEEQYSYMWNLPADQFKVELDAAVTDLRSRNLQTAQVWLDGLNSYGSSDAFLDSALGVVDVASVVPVATLGKLMKGVARVGAKSPHAIEEIATAAGRYEDGAVGKIVKELESETFFGGDTVRNMKELEDSVPSLSAPGELLLGSRNVPKEAYLRMKETLKNNSELARKFILEPNLVDRLSPDELLKYRDTLRADYVRQNPSIQKNVIGVEIVPEADIGNVYTAKVLIGKRDGTLFESEQQARNYFNRYIKNTDDYRIVPTEGVVGRTVPKEKGKSLDHFAIEQKGQGFQIEIYKSVDENRAVQDAFRIETNQQTPESFANTFGGWWRSSNYLISGQAREAASTAVTSSERMKGIFEEMARPLTSLPKQEMSELKDLMATNRQSQTYYENYGSFEQAFFDRFKKNPTVEQSEAYFTYVQMNDLDLVIRDLDWYKQKAAQGRQQIAIRVGTDDVSFEGRVVDNLPIVTDKPNGRFRWTVIEDGKMRKPRYSTSLRQSDRNEIDLLKEQGYKIYQIAGTAKVGDDVLSGFVVTKGAKENRVGVKNVDRKPGGHKVDTYQGYIKQGQVKRSADGASGFYTGDLTLLGAKSEKDGRAFVDLLNQGREKLLRNEPGAYKWFRDNVPLDTQKFIASVKSGAIDLSVPFSYTPKGVRTIDTGALSGIEGLDDVTKNIHNLDAGMTGRYSGSRDMSDIDVVRSEGDMQFEVTGAEYLDPITTLRMSSQNVISQRAMNDYSIMTARNFVREFGDILEGSTNELLSQGTQVVTNPIFRSGVAQSNPGRLAAAKNVSRAYRNLMNHGTDLDRALESYKAKIIEGVASKLGRPGQRYLDERSMWNTTNPGVFLRSVAFHSKLGLFNVNQLFVQANALVNVASIGGLAGMRGGLSYPLFRVANLSNSPEILNRLAKISETTGLMKADEFKESLALYKRSGYNSIGKDTAFLDDISGPEINERSVAGVGKKFLDYGTTPFREGERVVRMAAWQTAYLEKKAQVGRKALTRRDEAEILSRAKLLSVDMTREANATWQKGYAAVFTQFFSFQARLTEQFLGTRLTKAEKARLFLGYTFAYGAPTAVGAATGVLPFREVVNDVLYGMGIDPTQEEWRPLVDGFSNLIVSEITGQDLNISERYGAGGIPLIYDFMRGDQGLLETVVGASGSIFGQMVSDTVPWAYAIGSELLDKEGGLYTLTKEDMIAPFRNISSVNSAFQMYQVYNLGIWASKNDVNLLEMDLPQAVIAAITGLTPSELEAGFNRSRATRGWREEKDAKIKELTTEYKRTLRMDPSPEREIRIRRMRAEMEVLGLSPQDRWKIGRDAISEETVNERVWERWNLEVERKRRNGG